MPDRETKVLHLLRHGIYWQVVVIALDVGTSWVMMWLRGPESEGNPVQRLLFEHRDPASLSLWLRQEYVWLGLIVAGILSLLAARPSGRVGPAWLREAVLPFYWLVAFLLWSLAFVRLYLGPPGNTLSILLPFGDFVALAGGAVLFLAVLTVMLYDLRGLLLHRLR